MWPPAEQRDRHPGRHADELQSPVSVDRVSDHGPLRYRPQLWTEHRTSAYVSVCLSVCVCLLACLLSGLINFGSSGFGSECV